MIIIKGRTTPAARFILKGIKICEILNKHLKKKKETDLIKRKEWEAEHLFADSTYNIYLESSDEEIPLLKKIIMGDDLL
jgi:hypothetical protein